MSHVHYLSKLTPANFAKTVSRMANLIKRKFPTCNAICGRGFSGSMLIPALAARLKVDWIVVRKEKSHSSYSVEASDYPINPQVVFVDDIIDSGASYRETVLKIADRREVKMIGAALYEYNMLGEDEIGGVPIYELPRKRR